MMLTNTYTKRHPSMDRIELLISVGGTRERERARERASEICSSDDGRSVEALFNADADAD